MIENALAACDTDSPTLDLEWTLPSPPKAVEAQDEPAVEPGNVPRVSRLMALAIKFDDLICRGEVEDYATLARIGHVTRARITQIMALLNLAPDIQEAVLLLPRTTKGSDSITERDLRPLASLPHWDDQRLAWGQLRR